MIYINLEDIADRILAVKQSDIDAANSYVASLQSKLGVTDAAVQTPLPYTVKRLAVVYACYTAALETVGTDATQTIGENRQRTDIYEQKRKAYLVELTALSGSITADDFTGSPDPLGITSIPVWRA